MVYMCCVYMGQLCRIIPVTLCYTVLHYVTLCYTVLCSQAGETALHVTARYGYPDVLAFLCRSGAKLNIQDNVSPWAPYSFLTSP